VNEFEGTVKQLLNENVDAELGPHRLPPQLNVAAPDRTKLRPWLVPLVAAAGVAAAIGAIVVPAQLVADRPAGGAGGGLNVSSTTTSTPVIPQSPHSFPPTPTASPAATSVNLGGATLRLPAGWVASEVSDPNQYGNSVYSREWCLAPAETAGPPRADCPLQFGPAAAVIGSGIPVNFRVPLGIRRGGSQSPCPQSGFYGQSGWSLLHFGLRQVYDREWYGHCDGSPFWMEQYVVNTAPGYVLFSDQMTPELSAAMAEIAQYASLPAQAGQLWLYDIGIVQAVLRQSNGYLMTLAPIEGDGIRPWTRSDESPRSYPMEPTALKYAVVGTRVGVTTDGTKVIDIGAPISAP
jgi:hypothetical protein